VEGLTGEERYENTYGSESEIEQDLSIGRLLATLDKRFEVVDSFVDVMGSVSLCNTSKKLLIPLRDDPRSMQDIGITWLNQVSKDAGLLVAKPGGE